jgi:hypothetical protein
VRLNTKNRGSHSSDKTIQGGKELFVFKWIRNRSSDSQPRTCGSPWRLGNTIHLPARPSPDQAARHLLCSYFPNTLLCHHVNNKIAPTDVGGGIGLHVYSWGVVWCGEGFVNDTNSLSPVFSENSLHLAYVGHWLRCAGFPQNKDGVSDINTGLCWVR